MMVASAWLTLSALMLVVGVAAFFRMVALFQVVRPDEEDLRAEVWSRLRPLIAFIVAEIFFGFAAAVVQILPPSWNARHLTIPLLFAGQVVWFGYVIRLWWELEEIFDGRLYRAWRRFLMRLGAR